MTRKDLSPVTMYDILLEMLLPGQVSEELENRFRQMESSLNRLGMILDSVQSDVMQVNRAVKEVSLESKYQ